MRQVGNRNKGKARLLLFEYLTLIPLHPDSHLLCSGDSWLCFVLGMRQKPAIWPGITGDHLLWLFWVVSWAFICHVTKILLISMKFLTGGKNSNQHTPLVFAFSCTHCGCHRALKVLAAKLPGRGVHKFQAGSAGPLRCDWKLLIASGSPHSLVARDIRWAGLEKTSCNYAFSLH